MLSIEPTARICTYHGLDVKLANASDIKTMHDSFQKTQSTLCVPSSIASFTMYILPILPKQTPKDFKNCEKSSQLLAAKNISRWWPKDLKSITMAVGS